MRERAVAVLLVGFIGACQAAPPEADRAGELSLLFSQTAASATLQPASGENAYTLTLAGVDPHTIRFTDRPARGAWVVPTADFAATFAAMFAGSAPNAALVEHQPNGATDTLILTIAEPVYDATAGTLTYAATLLADEQHPERLAGYGGGRHAAPPSDMNAVSLFIDNAAGPSTTTCKLGPSATCSGVDLHGANLSNFDLSGIDLSKANLRGTTLINAKLKAANLSGADLSGANLSGADVRGANFGGATMGGATFIGGWIDGGVTGAVDYKSADFSQTQLVLGDGDDFSGAKLAGVVVAEFPDSNRISFSGANLSGARFGNVKPSDCRLQNATQDSRKIPPDTFYLGNTDFEGADLSGAEMSCIMLYSVGMRKTELDGVSWANSFVFGVDFKGAKDLLLGPFGGPSMVCGIVLPDGSPFADKGCVGWATVASATTPPGVTPAPTPCAIVADFWPFKGSVCLKH
jgi:uncharacterized protein YjbI with pentapeptide repeats